MINNDGPNCLHGGQIGYDKVLWNASVIDCDGIKKLLLSFSDLDGNNGFPGRIDCTVTYALLADNSLEITYNAVTTKSTPFKKIISSDKIIDLISIDIEGNELDVINSIDFNTYEIKVILLENNIPEKLNYIDFFKKRNFSYFDRVGMDEIYFNKKYFNF